MTTRLHLLALRVAGLLCALALLGCQSTANPASLWINYSQREIDLVLIDYEPPPF